MESIKVVLQFLKTPMITQLLIYLKLSTCLKKFLVKQVSSGEDYTEVDLRLIPTLLRFDPAYFYTF